MLQSVLRVHIRARGPSRLELRLSRHVVRCLSSGKSKADQSENSILDYIKDFTDNKRPAVKSHTTKREGGQKSWNFAEDLKRVSHGNFEHKGERKSSVGTIDDAPKVPTKSRSATKLKSFKKCFYVEHSNLKDFSDVEVAEYRKERQIIVTGKDVEKPVRSVEEAGFPGAIVRALRNDGISSPTPIQSQCWPMVMSGRNLVGIAQTGSGKTLAYVLPALLHITHQNRTTRGDGPICLVVTPTRELTQQIWGVADKYGRAMDIRSVCVYGGAGRYPQRTALRRGPEICIATPGRLNDFLDAGDTNMERCTFLVLDEADRMLDMGFEPQIRSIVDKIRSDRQTVMWSATWPKEVHSLAEEFLPEYSQVNIGSTDLLANSNITQHVLTCVGTDKPQKLQECLQEVFQEEYHKVLIFANTKWTVDKLWEVLRHNGISAFALHGDKSQTERDKVMHAFSSRKDVVMIATDVAARGLDVKDITTVINYDYPNSGAEDYIHRIGRTGRVDRKGVAFTFFDVFDDAKLAPDLVSVLRKTKQTVPLMLEELAARRSGSRNVSRYRQAGDFGRRRNFPQKRQPRKRPPWQQR